MTSTHSSTHDYAYYTFGFSDAITEFFGQFTAESSAAHLLPHLKRGQRILDFGCGAGSISVGLAAAVRPGEMHGVDMEASQVEMARAAAAAGGHDNAAFQVGDVADLPFADDFFDAAHCHFVLAHIPDTRSALLEVKRVMKPGGVIGCREIVSLGSFLYPDYGIINRSFGILSDLLETDDGHPQMGRELKRHLMDAGFEDISVSMEYDIYREPEDVEFIHKVVREWWLSDEIMDAAINYGAATEELRDGMRDAFNRWREYPGAFCAIAYGATVARKPT